MLKKSILSICFICLSPGCSGTSENPEQDAKDIVEEYREDINSADRLDVKFSVGAIELFARDSERNCKFLGSEEDCRFVEAIKKEMKPLGWCYLDSRFSECGA